VGIVGGTFGVLMQTGEPAGRLAGGVILHARLAIIDGPVQMAGHLAGLVLQPVDSLGDGFLHVVQAVFHLIKE